MTDDAQIRDLFKLYDANEFQKLQTKFAKLANGIRNDAVKSRLAVLLSDSELETLEAAASILGTVKNKIEHTKEKMRREEQHRKTVERECRQAGLKLFNQLFQIDPNDLKERFLVSMAIGGTSIYGLRQQFLREDSANYDLGGIRYWINDSFEDAQGLWVRSLSYDHDAQYLANMPDECKAQQMHRRYIEELRPALLLKHQDILRSLDRAIAVNTSSNITKLTPRNKNR